MAGDRRNFQFLSWCGGANPTAFDQRNCRRAAGRLWPLFAKSMLILPPVVAIDHLFPPYTPEKNTALKLWFEY
jgi:hypothetical protein